MFLWMHINSLYTRRDTEMESCQRKCVEASLVIEAKRAIKQTEAGNK